MRKTAFLVLMASFFAIFMTGCFSKDSVITLKPYSTYPKVVNGEKVASLVKVADKRESKTIIGMVKDSDGKASAYASIDVDLASWFESALRLELASNKVSLNENFEPKIYVTITDLSATMQGLDRDNMQGMAAIFVEIKGANSTISKRVSQSQSEFVVVKDSSNFKPFIESLLKDLVIKTAKEIRQSL